MANESANVALLKDAYARWNDSKGGSVDHWLTLIADDIHIGSLAAANPHPQLALAKTMSNAALLRSSFAEMLKAWTMLEFTPTEFVAQGDVVIMRGQMRWENKTTRKVFSSPKLDFWRFRDGKAVEFFEYFDTAGAQAAATG